MKVRWLQSRLRQVYLNSRFYSFPIFLGNKPIAEVYLSLNDPHSFMLMQVLQDIEQRFHLTLRLYLVAETTKGSDVNVPLSKQWALKDANYIADKYSLTKVKGFPSTKTLVTGQQSWLLQVKTVADALQVFNDTWLDKYTDHYPLSTPVITSQINNQRRLFRRGYYSSGAMFFCGNWFVGIDRLEYLERLLNEKGLNKNDADVFYTKNKLQLLTTNSQYFDTSSIKAYVSPNSPFSYIGLVQARKLSEHYHIPLSIKPLVPMSMRGIFIPEHKERYMLLDATREAIKLSVPLTEFAKLENQGVSNVYQLFSFAEKHGKSYELMMAIFQAIFVSPVDLSVEKNIKTICNDIGIDYDEAVEYANKHDWQQWAENNYLELNTIGLWGVPSFSYKDISCWGQDRLVQIEDAILTHNVSNIH